MTETPYTPADVADPANDPLPPRTFVIYAGHDQGVACPIFAFAHPLIADSPSRLAVPLPPSARAWQWNGDRERPTLTPSLNILGPLPWHGWVTAGVFRA